MPILDINKNPIQKYTNFPNDLNVLNIEFGAGKSNFGKIEFPNCYLTDYKMSSTAVFLDHQCDFFETDLGGRLFDQLIFCNPYDIGFNGLLSTQRFLDRAGDLLNNDGLVFILGNNKNPWAKKGNFHKYTGMSRINLKHKVEVLEEVIIDSEHKFIKEYTFTQCDLKVTTIPNEYIKLKFTKL